MPPQQVQEPGIVRLMHSGKTGLSDGLSPQPGAQASHTAPGPNHRLPGCLLSCLQLLPPLEEAKPQGVSKGVWAAPGQGHSSWGEAHLKYRKRKEETEKNHINWE